MAERVIPWYLVVIGVPIMLVVNGLGKVRDAAVDVKNKVKGGK